MLPNQLLILKQEIVEDPLEIGYKEHLLTSPGLLVSLLNNQNYTMVKSRMLTARAMLAELEDGGTLLDNLEQLALSIPDVKWAMKFITADGIDIGHTKTRYLLDTLVQNKLLGKEAVEQLKALAIQPASRGEVLGLFPITEEDIRIAMEYSYVNS